MSTLLLMLNEDTQERTIVKAPGSTDVFLAAVLRAGHATCHLAFG